MPHTALQRSQLTRAELVGIPGSEFLEKSLATLQRAARVKATLDLLVARAVARFAGGNLARATRFAQVDARSATPRAAPRFGGATTAVVTAAVVAEPGIVCAAASRQQYAGGEHDGQSACE